MRFMHKISATDKLHHSVIQQLQLGYIYY